MKKIRKRDYHLPINRDGKCAKGGEGGRSNWIKGIYARSEKGETVVL